MKRHDEEQCKAVFHQFLCAYYPESAISWKDGPDPPDFVLHASQDTFAVEVTTLMESYDLGDGPLPVAAVRATLQRFIKSVEMDARQAGTLQGSYIVFATKPIDYFASVKADAKRMLLQYIADTRTLRSAPETVVFHDKAQRIAILKDGDDSTKLVLGGPVFAKWEGEAVERAHVLLKAVLDDKFRKLGRITLPVILLIRDAYHFADAAMLRIALAGLESVEAFHTVFVVSDTTGLVLYSKLDEWRKATGVFLSDRE